MKCLLFFLLVVVPSCLCIISKPTKSLSDELSPTSSTSRIEPRLSAAPEQDKNKDLQAEQSIDHHHYDYPGGHGYGGGYGGGGYGGHGHYPVGGYGGGYGYGGDLALKTLLIPLAGAALLGAAAIFAYNPLLIQLGVVAGKKKRSIDNSLYSDKYKQIQQLEKFIQQLPREQVVYQEKRMLADYLACSGLQGSPLCLQRVLCHLEHPSTNTTSLDRTVLDIVSRQIVENELVPERIKAGVIGARRLGAGGGDCTAFYCSSVDIQPLSLH